MWINKYPQTLPAPLTREDTVSPDPFTVLPSPPVMSQMQENSDRTDEFKSPSTTDKLDVNQSWALLMPRTVPDGNVVSLVKVCLINRYWQTVMCWTFILDGGNPDNGE